MAAKREFLYEGKAKKLYRTEDPNLVWVEFKDDLTAFNALKKGSFRGKGQANLDIMELVFQRLEQEGVKTHFVERVSDTEMIAQKAEVYPLEVVVRNKAAGSLCKRLGLEKGKKLNKPLFEIFYKNDDLADPFLSFENAEMMGLCTWSEYLEIKTLALKVNEILVKTFKAAGLELVDFKIEFGKDLKGNLMLVDEISPDSCRLWDIETGESLDKDRFRQGLDRVEESYKEIFKRLKK